MNAISQKMIAHNDIDIINLRMAVREFARGCGFGSRDQACISLVSSSIAGLLRLGKEFDSMGVEILMEYCESGQQHGVRISCIKYHTKMKHQEVNDHLKSSHLLVDDIQMRTASLDGIEVIVTKWNSAYKG
jgi:hypothetical protein